MPPPSIPRRHVFDSVTLLVLIAAIYGCFLLGVIGWFLAPIVGGIIGGIWYALSRPRRPAARPGVEACPTCQSLQTDRVRRPLADGTEAESMECFVCGHEW